MRSSPLLFFALLITFRQETPKVATPKALETTVCQIMRDPSSFNNKLVKLRGYVSVSFEYSMLRAEGCDEVLWFALADGSGPPGLVATVNGAGRPGSKDSKGTPIKPISIKLLRDLNFDKFEHYMSIQAEAKPCFNPLSEPSPVDCDVERVTATFTGRIDSVSKQIHAAHLKRPANASPDSRGFGQMGVFDAQFVLQSVADVSAVDSLGRIKP